MPGIILHQRPAKPVKPELTAEHLRSQLHYDPATGVFTRKVATSNTVKVGDVAGNRHIDGYWEVSVLNKTYLAHKLAWLYVYGEMPSGRLTHINGDKSDNRIENLGSADSRKLANPKKLTADRLREVLDYCPETGEFTRKVAYGKFKAGECAGGLLNTGYVSISVDGSPYLAHRLAWLHVHGEWPMGHVDHINHIESDNRLCNLRDVTHKQNHQNLLKFSNNTSGYPGVCWHKASGKWHSRIGHHGKDINLGLFDDLEAAIAARKAAEKIYWADTHLG